MSAFLTCWGLCSTQQQCTTHTLTPSGLSLFVVFFSCMTPETISNVELYKWPTALSRWNHCFSNITFLKTQITQRVNGHAVHFWSGTSGLMWSSPAAGACLWLTLKYTQLPSFHLLLGLNLHSFEYVSSLQHNVVAHFYYVLRFIVSAIRHVRTDNPALRFAESKLLTFEVFLVGFLCSAPIFNTREGTWAQWGEGKTPRLAIPTC